MKTVTKRKSLKHLEAQGLVNAKKVALRGGWEWGHSNGNGNGNCAPNCNGFG